MPKVFISYSHDSAVHKAEVRQFARRLRDDRVDVVIDEDKEPGGPDEGWPAWGQSQAKKSDLLLLIVTESYARCWDGESPPGVRLGAIDEIAVVRNRVFAAGHYTGFCRVVTLDPDDARHVPARLAGLQTFHPRNESSYQGLVAWLRGPDAPDPARSGGAAAWPAPIPGFEWTLADRTAEFNTFKTMVAGQSTARGLMIRGDGNRGKTVMLAEMLNYLRHQGLHRVFVDLKGCPTLDDVFEQFLLDVPSEHLVETASAPAGERGFRLVRDLEKLTVPMVVVMDTYEKAAGPVRDWIEARLLYRLERMPQLVVVIGGREVPDAAKYTWRAFATTTELSPILDVACWLEWNARLKKCPTLTREHVEAFTQVLKGDPGQLSAQIEALGLSSRSLAS